MKNRKTGRIDSIPDVLTSNDGEKITTIEKWRQKRRPEILEMFRQNVYGRQPLQRPEHQWFKILEEKSRQMDGKATYKKIGINYEGRGGTGIINLHIYVPDDLPRPVPTFLLINNRGIAGADPSLKTKSSFWPAEDIVSCGYAAAVFENEDVDPDVDDGFKNGVHGIFDTPTDCRPADAWGTLSAWAWGASRAMDYFETDPDIDEKRVGLVGHSRGGKTALWCGAEDERFAFVVSNCSGCGGAAISREKKGETIKDIIKNFSFWFCRNYGKYIDKENELPVDQHMLLSLIAPRPLYVASATEDIWADPDSEFLSCSLAGSVYELFGLQGLETNCMPEPEHPLNKGNIGYHLRTGIHNLTEYDWKCFMDFAGRYLKD